MLSSIDVLSLTEKHTKIKTMKKTATIFLFLFSFLAAVQAQKKYFTKTARIVFLSNAPLETIEAVNKTAGAVLDSRTGAVQAVALMRGFEFRKALMQEHFNENYVESAKYPKAEFRGTLVNNERINYEKDGTYNTTAKGQLTLHGVAKDLETPVTVSVQDGKVNVTTTFTVSVADYRIAIPAFVKDKVSKNVKVTMDALLEPLHQSSTNN